VKITISFQIDFFAYFLFAISDLYAYSFNQSENLKRLQQLLQISNVKRIKDNKVNFYFEPPNEYILLSPHISYQDLYDNEYEFLTQYRKELSSNKVMEFKIIFETSSNGVSVFINPPIINFAIPVVKNIALIKDYLLSNIEKFKDNEEEYIIEFPLTTADENAIQFLFQFLTNLKSDQKIKRHYKFIWSPIKHIQRERQEQFVIEKGTIVSLLSNDKRGKSFAQSRTDDEIVVLREKDEQLEDMFSLNYTMIENIPTSMTELNVDLNFNLNNLRKFYGTTNYNFILKVLYYKLSNFFLKYGQINHFILYTPVVSRYSISYYPGHSSPWIFSKNQIGTYGINAIYLSSADKKNKQLNKTVVDYETYNTFHFLIAYTDIETLKYTISLKLKRMIERDILIEDVYADVFIDDEKVSPVRISEQKDIECIIPSLIKKSVHNNWQNVLTRSHFYIPHYLIR